MAKKRYQSRHERDACYQTEAKSQRGSTALSVRGSQVLMLVSLVCLGFLIYSNILENSFVFDDVGNIKNNGKIRLTSLSLEGITKASSSTRPVADLSFALNYFFHQDKVFGYHVVNIIIHISTGILLFFFATVTLRMPPVRSTMQGHRWIPFLAAFIWLVHPLDTQSVTYTIQRMNSMAAMFSMLSLLLYIRGRLSAEGLRKRETENLKLETPNSKLDFRNPQPATRSQYVWLAGSALSWVLALGCKQNAAVVPFIVLLYEWYFLQNLSKQWLKRNLKYFVGVMVLFGLIAFMYLGLHPWEKIVALNDYASNEFTLTERVLTQLRVVIYYLGLIFYPHPSRLNLDYDFTLSRSLFAPATTVICLLLILGLLGWACLMAKKERLVSFCIFWFFGNLAIESSVIPLALIYEHRTYLPSMLVILLSVTLAFRWVKPKALAIGGLCVLGIICSVWTYERNEVWRNDVTLWSDCVEKSPNNADAHNELGVALAANGNSKEAILHFSEALRLKPDFVAAHYHLGSAFKDQGNFDKAVYHYSQALRLKPDFVRAHNQLGNVFLLEGRLKEAILHYSEVLRMQPTNVKARVNLGVALERNGNVEEAIFQYSEALRLKPDFAEAHNNLGFLLLRQGDLKGAMRHFAEALRLKPEYAEAHYNMGLAFFSRGDINEAIEHFAETVRINPGHAGAHYSLGLILSGEGKLEEAKGHLLETLRIQPNAADAHLNLGLVLERQGKTDEAVRQYAEALRINPDLKKAREKLDILSKKSGGNEKLTTEPERP